MTATNQIFLVMDGGGPKAAFTTRREMQAYLKRRRDAPTKCDQCNASGRSGSYEAVMQLAPGDFYRRARGLRLSSLVLGGFPRLTFGFQQFASDPPERLRAPRRGGLRPS